jgi:hypothetical protein
MSCIACLPIFCLHAKQSHRPLTLSTSLARLQRQHLAMDSFIMKHLVRDALIADRNHPKNALFFG